MYIHNLIKTQFEFNCEAIVMLSRRKRYFIVSVTGKWYFEFEVLTEGFMKIGWMDVSAAPDTSLGKEVLESLN